MNQRSLLWGGIAALEAVAIVTLLWLLLGEAPALASPPPTPMPSESTAASDSTTVVDHPTTTLDAPAANPYAPSSRATPRAIAAEPMGTLVHGDVSVTGDSKLPDYVRLSLKAEGGTAVVRQSTLGREQRAFAWPDLPAGRYELSVFASGMRDHRQTVVVPDAAFDVRADVVLEPKWTVAVQLLTPDGRTLQEALQESQQTAMQRHEIAEALQVIALWREIPDALPYSDSRSTDLTVATWRSTLAGFGTRELAPGFAGQLELPERRAAFVALVLKESVLARAQLEPEQDELTMTIDPARLTTTLARLRLRVVDANGAPLTNAKVGLNDAQSWQQPTAVNAAGRVEFADHLPGQFRLSIECEGFASLLGDVVMPSGETVDLGTLRLQPQRELRIEILDVPDDAKLSGWLTPLAAPQHADLSSSPHALAIRNGKAQAQVADGRYRLRLTGAGGASLEFDTQQLGDRPLTVTLQPEAKLKIDSSAVMQPTRLLLQAPDGGVVLDRWVTWRGLWDRDVLPGTYRVTLQPLGDAARTLSVDVPPDGATLTM